MIVQDFTVKDQTGAPVSLADYAGKVLLIVNTASKCGFTPQLGELQALQERFASRGFSVLAFPCNQFGKQEPGDNHSISAFCISHYRTGFPIFGKIAVNGPNADPLFRFLCHERPGLLGSTAIKWNFTKFLIGRNGCPVSRHAPIVKPANLIVDMERLLG